MLKVKKQKSVEFLCDIYKNFPCVFVIRYQGLSVLELNSLRKALKPFASYLFVIKNSLALIASKSEKLETKPGIFCGPNALVYSKDIISTANILFDFCKIHSVMNVIGGFYFKKNISIDLIKELSSFQSLPLFQAKFVDILRSPVSDLFNLLLNPCLRFLHLMQFIKNK